MKFICERFAGSASHNMEGKGFRKETLLVSVLPRAGDGYLERVGRIVPRNALWNRQMNSISIY